MRKLLIVMVTVSLAVAGSYAYDGTAGKASVFNLGVWGGYTSADMSAVNDNLNSIASGGSLTKINSGYMGAVEGLFNISFGKTELSLGPRVEYIALNQGKSNPSTLLASSENTIDLSLIPVMVGGRYSLKNWEEKWFLSGGLFLGWGFASGKTAVKQSVLGLTIADSSYKYSGSGFVGDLILGGEYKFSKTVALGVDIGYRYAPISEMKTTEDVTELLIQKDSTIVDQNGSNLKFDFSGILANIGLIFRF